MFKSFLSWTKLGLKHGRIAQPAKVVVALMALTCAAFAGAQTASLTGLGATFSAKALSRNGQVVVGTDLSTNKAAYWVDGAVYDLPGVSAGSVANSCNNDGSVIVGQNKNLPIVYIDGELITLPLASNTTTGTATLISANGATIAGYCDGLPSFWTDGTLYVPPFLSTSTVLNSISDDGSAILCDATGGYAQAETSPGVGVVQKGGLISIGTLGDFLALDAVVTFFVNQNDPNNDVTGYVDPFCSTSNGLTCYGGAFDVYTETLGSGEVKFTGDETDGFLTISDFFLSPTQQLFNLSNFEVHSCCVDGSVLAGFSIAPNFKRTLFGNFLTGFVPGNSVVSFGGTQQDLLAFLTAKGASSDGYTLSNVGTQSMSGDGSVMLVQGRNGSASQSFIAGISPAVTKLQLEQTSLVGGSPVHGTVSLDYPAPANAIATLDSGNTAVIANTILTVPQGAMSAAFTVTSNAVTTATSVQLTATLGSTSASTTIVVNPPPPPAITEFAPLAGVIVGGNASTASVTLASAAGTGGYVVNLSSNTGGFTVPATVTVPSGEASVSFALTSTPVTAVTAVTLKATLGSSIVNAMVTVIPPTLSLVRIAPSPVVGGVSTKCAVYLNGKAPSAGQLVKLSSNNSLAKVPTSVTVASGSTSTNCTVTTSAVTSSTTVTITANTGAVTLTADFVLNPSAVFPGITQFSPSASVVVGGNAATATVTLASAAGSGGDVVSLSSSAAGITVPATVTVPAGKTSVSFSLASTPVSAVTAVTLKAVLGTSTEFAAITVIPPSVSVVRVAPSPVVGGVSTKVAVYLNGKAPVGGFVVNVASNSASAKPPATITVPAGATAANATLTTNKVSAATTAVITAKTGSTAVETTMVVNP